MTGFDLERTYLFIDGQGGLVAEDAGPDFWARIGSNPNAGGTMISAGERKGDWARREMHPAGADTYGAGTTHKPVTDADRAAAAALA